MNVIIIAALSLLVLVIISVLVLRAGGNLNRNSGCTGVQGTCVEDDLACTDKGTGWQVDPAHPCTANEDEPVCCIKL